MEKRIELENKDKIIITETPGYCTDMISIMKGYFSNGELVKTIRLSMWDDFSFEAWMDCDYDEVKKISFDFELNDPLYPYLDNLLKGLEKLIIDDDNTREEYKKTMIIFKENNKIVIVFENKLEKNKIMEKFNVFIKNILNDIRSKIDCRGEDTKIRLINFFNDVRSELLIESDEHIRCKTKKI